MLSLVPVAAAACLHTCAPGISTDPSRPAASAAPCRSPLPRSKTAQDADAQVLRSCVLLDELIEAEGLFGSGGPIVVAQASVVRPHRRREGMQLHGLFPHATVEPALTGLA